MKKIKLLTKMNFVQSKIVSYVALHILLDIALFEFHTLDFYHLFILAAT